MKMISKFFSWEEVTRSDTAERLEIDNTLPPELYDNAKYAASKMDYARIILECPILGLSWFRCELLERVINKNVYEAWCKSRNLPLDLASWKLYLSNKDHPKALAIDFISPDFGTPLEICKYILQYRETLCWKQLILEHTWVHISFHESPEIQPLGQVLTLLANKKYALGLTDKYGIPI